MANVPLRQYSNLHAPGEARKGRHHSFPSKAYSDTVHVVNPEEPPWPEDSPKKYAPPSLVLVAQPYWGTWRTLIL